MGITEKLARFASLPALSITITKVTDRPAEPSLKTLRSHRLHATSLEHRHAVFESILPSPPEVASTGSRYWPSSQNAASTLCPSGCFGVRVIGAAQWIHTILALEHLGLDPKRDNISTLAIGDEPQIVRALETGAIDAAVLSQAQSRQLKAKRYSVLLDLHPANIYGAQSALVVTTAYLQQHPDVIGNVLTALVEATAFSLAPKNKPTVLSTIMKLFNLTDLEAAERAYKSVADLNRRPYPAIERLKGMQKVMAIHEPKCSMRG